MLRLEEALGELLTTEARAAALSHVGMSPGEIQRFEELYAAQGPAVVRAGMAETWAFWRMGTLAPGSLSRMGRGLPGSAGGPARATIWLT